MHRIQPLRDAEYRKNADPLVRLCKTPIDPYAGPCSPLLVAVGDRRSDPARRYDTDSRRNDAPWLRGACAQRSTEAARLSSEEDNPAA